MMMILDENESKIVKALLYYLAEKHNNYWDTDSEIDYDKEKVLYPYLLYLTWNMGSKSRKQKGCTKSIK